MSKQELTKKELIERIEMGKHDIKMRVRAIVLDPIQSMSIGSGDAASESYYKEQGRKHEVILKTAESIMLFFSEKWRSSGSPEDEQIEQLNNYLSDVVVKRIPEIRTVVSFYRLCLDKRYYFTDTDDGNDAMTMMKASVDNLETVCKDLEELGNVSPDKPLNNYNYNLLEILQEILDGIKAAYVIYNNEVVVSTYEIDTDKDVFQNRVLLNIRENIEKHAFGTRAYKEKHVWEKKVVVSVKKANDSYSVSISNNGTPFRGDPHKVFDFGYCFGEQKHSGVGLNSAYVHMKQLGGRIEFKSLPLDEFPVSFVINIPIGHV